jgi:hypothetical protein
MRETVVGIATALDDGDLAGEHRMKESERAWISRLEYPEKA